MKCKYHACQEEQVFEGFCAGHKRHAPLAIKSVVKCILCGEETASGAAAHQDCQDMMRILPELLKTTKGRQYVEIQLSNAANPLPQPHKAIDER